MDSSREEYILEDTLHSQVYITYIDGKKCVKKVYKHDELHEGDILSSLDHPNIIKPIGIKDTYILLPFYEKTLADYVEGIPYRILKKMIVGLLKALEYLHSKDIIHGDIKQQNILMDGENLLLIDFTSSRRCTTHYASYSRTTKVYRSPESKKPHRIISPALDIWSLGIVLVELLTGEFIYDNTSLITFRENKVFFSDRVVLVLMSSGLLGKVIYRMLTYDYTKRPTASECIAMLV